MSRDIDDNTEPATPGPASSRDDTNTTTTLSRLAPTYASEGAECSYMVVMADTTEYSVAEDDILRLNEGDSWICEFVGGQILSCNLNNHADRREFPVRVSPLNHTITSIFPTRDMRPLARTLDATGRSVQQYRAQTTIQLVLEGQPNGRQFVIACGPPRAANPAGYGRIHPPTSQGDAPTLFITRDHRLSRGWSRLDEPSVITVIPSLSARPDERSMEDQEA